MKSHPLTLPSLLVFVMLGGSAAPAEPAAAPPAAAPAPADVPATAPAKETPRGQVDSWPDRRVIGVIFLSEGGASAKQPGFRTGKNPRGWNPFFHKDRAGKPLDVADPNYGEKFDTAVDAFVMQSFDRAERLNCQGVLFWDIEGSEFDHPTTYVGDPLRLPPELKRDRVKAWVEELKRRKMWAGFTLRDTQFVSTPYGADQVNAADPAEVLMWKMQKARFVYGDNCKGTYVDTFVEADSWVDGKPHARPAALLEKIQSRLPGWLIMPEFAGKDYDKVPRVAPIRYFGSPSAQAFEARLATNKPITPEQREEYVRSLRAGALTLVAVTWDAPQTEWVPEVWREAMGKK
jgi:hypothetical protein